MLDRIRKASRRILDHAEGLPLQIFIRAKKGILARFTNNGVHQNGFQEIFSYTLRLLTSSGPVFAESNDVSELGIQETLRRLRTVAPDPEPFSPPPKADTPKKREHFPFPLEKAPERAAQAVQEAVGILRRAQASANGYYSAYERFFYLSNPEGLELFHPTTAVRFGVTAIKGGGKGYFSFYHPDPCRLDVPHVVQESLRVAEAASRQEIPVPPGEYECIFSPRAFLELIEPLRRHFDARLTQDGKSVFTGLLGKQVFSKEFTMREDLGHPRQFGIPFDSEGHSKRRVDLVEGGVLKGLLGEGHSTRGLLEHPFYPQNLVVEEGTFSLQELFEKIERGIFINKIWYHTLVREPAMEVTGLATAGSLYLEKGRIVGRAVHLRYHDSLFSILNSVAGASREQILLKDGEMGAALFPYLWVSRLRVV